jgi:RHS repeat-associated protein
MFIPGLPGLEEGALKKAVIAVIAVLLMLTATLAHATDSDTGETPEIQYNTTSAPDLNAKAAALASPVNIYEYVRNNAEFALYHGSRSGSINSFLGLRGNDVDLASTLIAMYRSRGYHARYAVGTVQVDASRVVNWLGVKNLDLAVCIMKDQGIQNVTLAADRSYVQFEHVWAEALLPYGNYRGSGADAASATCTASSNCHWVALDPSFKQKQYNDQGIDPYSSLQFDYTSYYNAIKNSDSTRTNKNPLEIYEEQLLTYLQANYPGKTLEDVAYTGDIITQENLILPASLAYTVVGTPRRYNSAADHDAVVPTTEPKKWKKSLSIQFNMTIHPSGGGTINLSVGGGTALLVDLATKRLTLTTEINGGIPNVVVRLDGTEIARPLAGNGTISGYTPAIGDPFSLTVTMDGTPAATSDGTDEIISATYSGIVGGYYLLATGGETSNWTQVHRAAQQLLTANQQYKIVFNSSETGCLAGGINCTPYVDINGTGVYASNDLKLLDDKPALDALTGGLLYVASTQYYAKLRDGMGRVDALNHVKTPISGFLGVVSATHEAEYIDGTSFSVLPGGLLIDMKGITITGSWRIDQAANASNSQFQLIGHIVSSLEHETWQELTGYDAISTVRGIQMALSSGATLLDLQKNTTTDTVQTMYPAMGYTSSPPSGFTLDRRSIYTTMMDTWSYTTTDSTHSFMLMEKQPTGTSDTRLSYLHYYNDYTDSNVNCFYTMQNTLQSLQNQYGANATLNAGSLCISSFSAGTTIASAINLNKSDYASYRLNYLGATVFDYLDENKGFSNTAFVYRGVNGLSASAQPSTSVATWRNILYLQDLAKGWNEIVVPSQLSTGPNFTFSVDIWKTFDTSNNMTSATFEIQNEAGVSAGGGYVPANGVLLQQATSISLLGSSNAVPTFNNAVFTSQNTIAQTNNDVVKTPSTTDPVSTVTGNNYHDETDFTIKGRGLDLAFTRTYNSAPSSTNHTGPLGYGWTHSYNMKLKSNDYGACPNCTSAQAPENGNSKTSSITFTDERGGEHNYLVNESTYAVTPPAGEFDTLALDTPSAGYYTLTFRNGVKYVFQGTNLKTAPGNTAKLTQIADPYGNQLNFTYTGSNLTSVNDNLGISGRTGLTLTYYAGNQLKDITDWSGRKWSYVYDTYGNLQSVINPIPKTIQYAYSPAAGHNLALVTLPESRGGTPVTTTFNYYQNGKTFNYSNSLGHTETMDYDLYRKSTRVTDPRGFIREYEYDSNGLMTKLTEPDNGIHQFNNTSDMLRYKKTDGLGYNTTYSYRTDHAVTGASDTGGNVTQETDTLANTLQYGYGVYDQVTTVKDKNGNTRTMAYYATTNASAGAVAGKLQSVTLGSLNGTTNVLLQSYTYNPDGTVKQMVEQIDPANSTRKRITDYVWENNKGLNLQSVTVSGSGQSAQTTFGYDALGRRQTATQWRRNSPSDPTLIGLTTTYTYDTLDRVTQITDPLGNYMETVYDGDGKVYLVKGHYKKPDSTFDVRIVSTRTYDAADRLSTDTDIYGRVTQFAYDEAGNLIQTTDPNGHVTRFEYDAMNRRTAAIDANDYKSTTVYDLAGHPVQVVNALGKTVTTAYDQLGRPVTLTDPLGYQTTFAYDSNGNVTKMTDANANAGLQPKNSYGATLYKMYDELNRVKSETDALGGVTSYTYDLLGNITSVTDAEGRITYFDFDDLGRLIKVRDTLVEAPTDKATTFTYYETGNVLTRTKRSGATATYTLDVLNRLAQALYSSSAGSITETTVYDIYGNKYTVGNPDVTYTYAYDLKNRPTLKIDGRASKSLSYTYDPAGNIATKTNYDGSTTEYRYDSANRLVSERNQEYLEVSYQYDGAGRLLNRILSNGAMTGYTWDDGNRLASLTNTSAIGTIVNSASYVRDRLGNIISQTDASGTTTFIYDALYRLSNADYPGTTNDQSFTYDKVGNRKTMTKAGTTLVYVLDVDNRLKEIHQGTATGPLQNSYIYDDDGNLTTKKDGVGTILQSLFFDAKGRPNNIQGNSYKYDPYDYRIYKFDSHGNQTYLLEGEHLEGVMNGSTWLAKYFRGAVIDEIVNGFQNNTSGVWTNYTFHHDALQSVLGLSGHEGSVLQTIQYGPFGDKTATTGSANNNYLHFTGREEDTDNGLYYFRARYYDPTIGRFITEDPKGFGAGVNFYAYAQNNPINANDPYGFYPVVMVTLPNGSQYTPTTWVKNSTQAMSLNLPVGTSVPIAVPPGKDPQAMVDTWKSKSPLDAIEFAWTWRPRGDNDYKQGPGNSKYDAYGNFEYGATGAAAGFSSNVLVGMGDLLHNGNNNPINTHDIESGSFAISNGGKLSTTDYAPTSSSTVSAEKYLNVEIVGFDEPGLTNSAAGGFVLYPNKPNMNMMRSVYSK